MTNIFWAVVAELGHIFWYIFGTFTKSPHILCNFLIKRNKFDYAATFKK